MEMKNSEAQLLGQLLGLLILLGILLIKIVIIFLDKKWHEKGHRSMEGIRDLPPLYTDQSEQHPLSKQWKQRVLLRTLQSPVSTGLDQMYGLDTLVGSQNSNWILTKRLDSRQSQELK